MKDTKGTVSRLKEAYGKVIVPELMKTFGYKNVWQVPRLVKIVVNLGLSEAKENIKVIDTMAQDISLITGQKPQVRRAKISISNFKLRAGMPIGLKVTLRGDRMYEFLDRLITCTIPRIRDFHGFPANSGFDGQGNYNLGFTEHHIFPEVDIAKSDKARGMNISFVTTSKKDNETKELLSCFGMPFRK